MVEGLRGGVVDTVEEEVSLTERVTEVAALSVTVRAVLGVELPVGGEVELALPTREAEMDREAEANEARVMLTLGDDEVTELGVEYTVSEARGDALRVSVPDVVGDSVWLRVGVPDGELEGDGV